MGYNLHTMSRILKCLMKKPIENVLTYMYIHTYYMCIVMSVGTTQYLSISKSKIQVLFLNAYFLVPIFFTMFKIFMTKIVHNLLKS